MKNVSKQNFDSLNEFLEFNSGKPVIAIQGLGFVGSAMVAVLTQLKDIKGDLVYNVVGVDVGILLGNADGNSLNDFQSQNGSLRRPANFFSATNMNQLKDRFY